MLAGVLPQSFFVHCGQIAEPFDRDLVTLCALSLRPRYDQRAPAVTVLFKHSQPWHFCYDFGVLANFTSSSVGAKSWIRTGFGRSYGKYRMGPDRIYGKLREITIFRYRDSAPLPVRMRNGRYISYFTHQLDYDKLIYLFF